MPLPPLVAAGLIGAGSSFLSNVFGKYSQDSANNANYQIAQMNNQWSEKMLDKQANYNLAQWERESAYNTEMFNKTNEYNSAKNQARRIRDAGLNPALLMGGANAGSASAVSAPSSNGVGLPSPSTAIMQPYDFSGFANIAENAFMLASQLEKNMAETNFINTQKDVLKQKSREELANFQAKTRNINLQNKHLRYDLDYKQFMESTRVSIENEDYLGRLNHRLLEEQQRVLLQQAETMNEIQITNLPAQMKADIALKIATAENQSMTDFAKDLKFFEKKYSHRISQEELRMIYEAYKKRLIFAPYKSDAATLGGVIGDKIKGLWKE